MRKSIKCLALFISVIMIVTVMPALLVSAAEYTEDFSDWSEATTFDKSTTYYFGEDGETWTEGTKWTITTGSNGVTKVKDGALNFDHSDSVAGDVETVIFTPAENITGSVEIEFDYNIVTGGGYYNDPTLTISGIGKNVLWRYDGKLYFSDKWANGPSSASSTNLISDGTTNRVRLNVDYSTGKITCGYYAYDKSTGTYADTLTMVNYEISFDNTKDVTGLTFKFGTTDSRASKATKPYFTFDNLSIKPLAAAPVALSCELDGTTATTTFNSAAVADFTDNSVYLVTGLFDANGNLLQVVAGTEALTEGTATHTAEFTADANATQVKVFAWDATDKLTPITASVTESLN